MEIQSQQPQLYEPPQTKGASFLKTCFNGFNTLCVVERKDCVRALRAVHSRFYLSKTSIAVGIIGPGLIGTTLLNQLRDQAAVLKEKSNTDLRVMGITGSMTMLLISDTGECSTNCSCCPLFKILHGFHEFEEFTAEEVGTAEIGLNSKAQACNNEMILILVNEQVYMEEKGVRCRHNTSSPQLHITDRGHNIPKDLL